MEINGGNIPKFIFERALENRIPDQNAKILEIKNRCITEKGKNFLSDLFEVSVRYTSPSKNENRKTEHSLDAIIKTEPISEFSLSLVRQQCLFSTELSVLRDVLPKVKELLGYKIGPQLWFGCENPPVLIMENLSKEDFILKDRQKGLSFEHCCLVMQRIAKFHATSIAVFEKEPGLIESFKDSGVMSTKCPSAFCRLFEVSLVRIGNQVQTWPGEKYVSAGKKLVKLATTAVSRCVDVYKYDDDEFCVLNHGDCWVNNIMFKENENGRPTDVTLVDYQMSVYTSPAIDLLYFLNICPEYAVKCDNDENFLEIYLDTLTETMRKIGCKRRPPTMEELKETIYKRRIYGVFAGIFLHLRMMANKEDTEDFTLVLGKLCGETRMDVFKNPDALQQARKMIPVMHDRGWLD